MISVRYAVEGLTDVAVARRLISVCGLVPVETLVAHGKTKLDPRLPGFNAAAQRAPYVVLRDADHDSGCIVELRDRLLGDRPAPLMCCRIAVREIESWLLADHEGFRDFFHVQRKPPDLPDNEDRPKRTLVNLCRRSRRIAIREGIVPREGSGRSVGPDYVALVGEFASSRWSPEEARERSDSLDRALRCIESLPLRL